MNEQIIMPDDKTIEKMAREYSKIKAKTFKSSVVETLTTEKPHKYTLVPKTEQNYEKISQDVKLISDLTEYSLALLRQVNSTIRVANEKALIRNIINNRQNMILKVNNLNLYGQICDNPIIFSKYPNLTLKKQTLINQFLIIDAYTALLEKLSYSPLKKQLNSLKNAEIELSVKLLLLIG